jgi:hypothetical protein
MSQYTRWIFWGFAAVGAFYLLTEHRGHLLDYLPYVLLMACPLMHLFHGHGGHGRHEEKPHPHHDEERKMS